MVIVMALLFLADREKMKTASRYLLTFLLFFSIIGCTTVRVPNSTGEEGSELTYPEILETARDLTAQIRLNKQDPRFKPYRALVESQIISYLLSNPKVLNQELLKLLENIRLESLNTDLSKHHRLVPPSGTSGYQDLKFYVNHPYYYNRRLVPPSDLSKVWKDFLKSAQKEIVFNIYDFDLQDVADVLIARAKAGVQVRLGIDDKVIGDRPEVKAVYDRLLAGGVTVTAVDSVGLNHQKMAAIDWSIPDRAQVLFSSGNLTTSCMAPKGDLSHLNLNPSPPESVPNANHVMTMKSWLLANLVNHELTKTLDKEFLFRGDDYPITGAYQVTGPGVNPETLEAYPIKSMIITFTPGGALKNVNKNFLGELINKTSGRVRMIQFAYSSTEVDAALLSRAQRENSSRGRFDFGGIGDTPFAMQGWSQFLNMSGWEQKVSDDKTKKWYAEVKNGPWMKSLNRNQMQTLRDNIRIAPSIYGNNTVSVAGKKIQIISKIHHKILSTGDFAVVGTSFNFSQGAEKNNEQILVFRDADLVARVEGMYKWLADRSPRSVHQEALRRNTLPRLEEPEVDDSESRSINPAGQVAPSPN